MINGFGVLMGGGVIIMMTLFYFFTMFRVGAMRGKHGIKAPACMGHPEFERAYRVQMNTLEQMGITFPLFWVATLFPLTFVQVVPAIGVVWVVGRILYMRAYMADPGRRLVGMMIGLFCNVALLVLAVGGLARAWLAMR